MNAEEKLAKQRAVLVPYIKEADYILEHGVREIRYFKNPEADECETQLKNIVMS